MSSLEKRISKLEPQEHQNAVRVIMLVPLMAKDAQEPTATAAVDSATGERLCRNPDESLPDFRGRVSRWAMSRNPGISMVALVDDDYGQEPA